MATHRLSIEDFDEINYELVAIHTSLEDYRLAYLINQKLPILLSKNPSEIQSTTKEGEARFSRFTFENADEDFSWNLIRNKHEELIPVKSNSSGLFGNANEAIASRAYFLPELKIVDYFLKIENSELTAVEVVAQLNSISDINTIYKVNTEQIKSKNNLIF